MEKNVRDQTIATLCRGLEIEEITGTCGLVSGLALDSRKVLPGSLFFAIKGFNVDGNRFVEEAINRGAVAIVSENVFRRGSGVVGVRVKDVRRAMAQISRNFYACPDEKLNIVGVTGTNGKTTVTTLSQFLLQGDDGCVGMLGTICYDFGQCILPAVRTTLEPLDSYSMLGKMVAFGCREGVLEVSSHGIELDRVWGMKIEVVVFLNLTQDHLDFHSDMEDYYKSKRKLFIGACGSMPRVAVVNSDAAYGKRLAAEVPQEIELITFGRNPKAMIRAENVQLNAKGIHFNLISPEGKIPVESRLLGHYSVENVLAALSICWARGRRLQSVVDRLGAFKGVRGRMERIECGQDFSVLIDYAHTEDALMNGLKMLRAITPKRLLVVFGCGGSRDCGKRSGMTRVVQEYADRAWATSDNPRKESIDVIFDDMRGGVTMPERIVFVEDRRRAIDKALKEAGAGDCVLIAGKGHETYQEFADRVVPFDDAQVVRELLSFKREAVNAL